MILAEERMLKREVGTHEKNNYKFNTKSKLKSIKITKHDERSSYTSFSFKTVDLTRVF